MKISISIVRNISIMFFIIIIVNSVFSQQILFNIGDNIIGYLDKNPTQYLTYVTFLIDSPDGRVDFLKFKPDTTETDIKFLVQDKHVFGVMQYKDE